MAREGEPPLSGPRPETQGPLREQDPLGPGVEREQLHPPPRQNADEPQDQVRLHHGGKSRPGSESGGSKGNAQRLRGPRETPSPEQYNPGNQASNLRNHLASVLPELTCFAAAIAFFYGSRAAETDAWVSNKLLLAAGIYVIGGGTIAGGKLLLLKFR